MNRLLITASRSAAPALRTSQANAPSSISAAASRFVTARYFSDTDDIKVGTVKNFGGGRGFGFIIPDGVDPDPSNHTNADLCFIHRNDIMKQELGERYTPSLRRGDRVQYKLKPREEGSKSVRAYDLTYEGGNLVPPFQQGYLDSFTKKQKAQFGDEVYEIFRTSRDQKELEMKIVAAYDKTKAEIEKVTDKVTKALDSWQKNDEE